jgi:hypothetical protein
MNIEDDPHKVNINTITTKEEIQQHSSEKLEL